MENLAFLDLYETYETRFTFGVIAKKPPAPRTRHPRQRRCNVYQLIGAAFCVAAGLFLGSGDPIIGLLVVLCAVVWVATTPVVPPVRRAGKPPMLIRLE